MPDKSEYATGQPCWVDLGTPDQDAAGRFYGALFGWKLEEDENAEQTGGYRTAQLRGKPVGGVMKLMQEGQPPAWTTYVKVDDAEATAARVRDAGGQVVFEPMQVLDYGTMAIVADPEGSVLGLWQPGVNRGSAITGEHGAPTWSELGTRDPQAAKSFYGDVFGWRFADRSFERGAYTTIEAGGSEFGGITDRVPEGTPSHWLVYFAVDDAEAAVSTAKENGGEIPFGPMTMAEVGTIAVIEDPWGAVFAVIEPSAEMAQGA
jgi:predicted enzyme related to lactoylglutathione lyase